MARGGHRDRARALRPEVRLVGVQSAACAPFAGREPTGTTIADGIAVKHPGVLTRPILEDLLDDVVVVDDDEISQAIVLLLERSKLVVEGRGAARWPGSWRAAQAVRARRAPSWRAGTSTPPR